MSSDPSSLPPVRVAQLRARRSPRLMALGVLLACLGGLGGAWVFQQSTQANQVVVVQRTIARGETVTASDLGVATVGSAPGVRTIPADELQDLVGQQALVDLPQGSLVGSGSVGRAQVPEGFATVGLKLAAGRLPVLDLPQGTAVQVVQVTSEKDPGHQVVDATVVTSPRTLPDGSSQVLDLAVAADRASLVADLAARDLVVVVRKAA